MIYTVTFNPSIDYFVGVKDFKTGVTNRTSDELMFPGGKGINVSLVLRNLGIESMALGFTGGFIGSEIERRLKEWGCLTDFVKVKEGISRINVKIQSYLNVNEYNVLSSDEKNDSNENMETYNRLEETEINGQGPVIAGEELEEFYKKLEQLREGDFLVLAGSIPGSLSAAAYEDILKSLEGKDINCIVDATGQLLVNVLKYQPFLIKPNNHELEEIFDVKIKSNEKIIFYGKKLQEMGARNVLISMAGDGAVLLAEDGNVYESPAPKGKVINSVGAGDSMVAGFLAGYLHEQDFKQAFIMGIAAGSASAFSEGLATLEEVEKIIEMIR